MDNTQTKTEMETDSSRPCLRHVSSEDDNVCCFFFLLFISLFFCRRSAYAQEGHGCAAAPAGSILHFLFSSLLHSPDTREEMKSRFLSLHISSHLFYFVCPLHSLLYFYFFGPFSYRLFTSSTPRVQVHTRTWSISLSHTQMYTHAHTQIHTHTLKSTHTHSPPTRCEEPYALTLAVRPVVRGEGGPVVRGSEAPHTGAGIAAHGVVAGGAGATDLPRSDLTFVFV